MLCAFDNLTSFSFSDVNLIPTIALLLSLDYYKKLNYPKYWWNFLASTCEISGHFSWVEFLDFGHEFCHIARDCSFKKFSVFFVLLY